MTTNNYLPSTLLEHIERQYECAQAVSAKEIRRLFHGRSGVIKAFSQVVIDWLPNVVVIRLYEELEQPILTALVEYLSSLENVQSVVVQERGRHRETRFDVVYGECPDRLIVEENGLKFQVNPLQNQNFGLFLDMRNGRQWLREQSQDKKVLNLFAYTCAFSVAALVGDAKLVVNVDLSKKSLSVGRVNHQLNDLHKSKSLFMPYDMLRSWSRIKKPGPYDIVVIDPPSFQPGSFVVQKDYAKVLRRLEQLTSDNALVMVCHNDPNQSSDFIKDLMAEECPGFQYQQRLTVPDDFYEENLEKSLKTMIYIKST